MMSLTRITCVALALLALPGASLACVVPPDADGQASSPAPQETVTLTDAGAEPRTALRYRMTVGATQTFSLVSTTKASQRLDGTPLPSMDVPRMLMTCTIVVDRISDDGTIHTTFTVGESGFLKPKSGHELALLISELKGVTGTLVLTDRGLVVSSEVTGGAGDRPELAAFLETLDQTLRQILMPLPEEPIGAGGVWRVARTVTPNGTTVQERLEVTLKRTGERIELESVITQHAEPQTVTPPRAGATPMQLTRHEGRGTVGGRYPLTQFVPDLGVITMKTSSDVELEVGSVRQRLQVELDATTTIKPGERPK